MVPCPPTEPCKPSTWHETHSKGSQDKSEAPHLNCCHLVSMCRSTTAGQTMASCSEPFKGVKIISDSIFLWENHILLQEVTGETTCLCLLIEGFKIVKHQNKSDWGRCCLSGWV